MQGSKKMQYVNVENFIFCFRKRFLGEMHKVSQERQMFLCQNHTLRFGKILHKIVIDYSDIMGKCGLDF